MQSRYGCAQSKKNRHGSSHTKNFCWPAAKWSDFIGWEIFSANVSAAHVCFHQNEAFLAANLQVFLEFGFTCEFNGERGRRSKRNFKTSFAERKSIGRYLLPITYFTRSSIAFFSSPFYILHS